MNRTTVFITNIGMIAGIAFMLIMIMLWYSPYHSVGLTIALGAVSCAEFVLTCVYVWLDYLEANELVKKEAGR